MPSDWLQWLLVISFSDSGSFVLLSLASTPTSPKPNMIWNNLQVNLALRRPDWAPGLVTPWGDGGKMRTWHRTTFHLCSYIHSQSKVQKWLYQQQPDMVWISLETKSRVSYIPVIGMMPAQVRKKKKKKIQEGRARLPALTCSLGSYKEILLVIYWEELILNHWLGGVLPLDEVSKKTGIQAGSVARPMRTFFFWGQLASVPGRRFYAAFMHLLNSSHKNLKKWKKKKEKEKQIIHTCGCQVIEVPMLCTPGKSGRSAAVSEENTTANQLLGGRHKCLPPMDLGQELTGQK